VGTQRSGRQPSGEGVTRASPGQSAAHLQRLDVDVGRELHHRRHTGAAAAGVAPRRAAHRCPCYVHGDAATFVDPVNRDVWAATRIRCSQPGQVMDAARRKRSLQGASARCRALACPEHPCQSWAVLAWRVRAAPAPRAGGADGGDAGACCAAEGAAGDGAHASGRPDVRLPCAGCSRSSGSFRC